MASLIFYLLVPLPMIGVVAWIALLLGKVFVTKLSETISQRGEKRNV